MTEALEFKTIYKRIEDIKPYKENPRANDKAVDAVAESIKEYGWQQPIVVDTNMIIIAGHTRLKAAKKLGLKQVPVKIADNLTENQIQQYRLVDNKTAELADWDLELLSKELKEIIAKDPEADMVRFGFDGSDLNFDMDDIIEDEPEIKEVEPVSKKGQLYRLGKHRLYIGDSTKEKDVKILMGGELADLVVTDPPYNVDYTGKTKEALKIDNDIMTDNEFVKFLSEVFNVMRNSIKPGGVYYIWHSDSNRKEFLKALAKNKIEVRQILIWIKNSLVLGRQDYNWKHEPCLYGWVDGAAHYYNNDFTQTTVYDPEPNLSNMTNKELIEYAKELRERLDEGTTIIRVDRPAASREHPTMKPVKLFAHNILHSSKRNEKVLDLFAGSGTLMIACEQLGRRAYMMEYDPVYADVIIKRYEDFTGEKAELLN